MIVQSSLATLGKIPKHFPLYATVLPQSRIPHFIPILRHQQCSTAVPPTHSVPTTTSPVRSACRCSPPAFSHLVQAPARGPRFCEDFAQMWEVCEKHSVRGHRLSRHNVQDGVVELMVHTLT